MCPYTVLHLHCHFGFSVGVSVCVCLYGFTFEISHRTLRRGGACSSRCTKLCHSINPCKYDYISRFALSTCLLMNALLALRPCKAFGRSTSGIHARPRKRVRFCCSVKPNQLWWGLKLIAPLSSKLLSNHNPHRHGSEMLQKY